MLLCGDWVCLSVSLSVFLSVCLSVCQSVSLSVCQSGFLSICLFIYLFRQKLYLPFYFYVNYSVVGVETRLLAGRSGLPRIFRPALKPTQPRIRGYQCCFPNVRLLGHDVDHSPSYNVGVKNECSYASPPPLYLHGLHIGNFAFFNATFTDFTYILYVQLYVHCLHMGPVTLTSAALTFWFRVWLTQLYSWRIFVLHKTKT